MTQDEALKLAQDALEALENISTALREDDVLGSDNELMLDAITTIRETLAQPDEDAIIIRYHEMTIKRLEKRIEELTTQTITEEHIAKVTSDIDLAVNKALAQPEQEPVATLDDLEQEIYENTRQFVSRDVMEWMLKRYYTTPPQRTWVGLTDEEKQEWIDAMPYDPQPRHCMILVNTANPFKIISNLRQD